MGPFLRNQRFVERHLGDELAKYARELLEDGSELERFVLNWTLENLVPIRLLPERPHWTYLSYEQCVLEPERTLDDIASRAATHRRRCDGAQARAGVAVVGPVDGRDAGAHRGRATTTTSWAGGVQEVDESEERRAMAVLERFDIGLYRAGALTPEPAARFERRS